MKSRGCGFLLAVLLLCTCRSALAADPSPASMRSPFTAPPRYARTQSSQPQTSDTPGLDLRATMIAKEWSMADVNGTLLMPGETINGYRLLQVLENKAVFLKNDRKIIVTIDDEH